MEALNRAGNKLQRRSRRRKTISLEAVGEGVSKEMNLHSHVSKARGMESRSGFVLYGVRRVEQKGRGHRRVYRDGGRSSLFGDNIEPAECRPTVDETHSQTG